MPYKDKDRQKEFQRKEYSAHKDRYSERNRARRAERKKWFFDNVLKGLSCSVCGENDPVCLDFHHVDPTTKEGTVSQMVNEFRSKTSILLEVSKCEVVCANCHRKIHAKT
jgi:hypothetical protein